MKWIDINTSEDVTNDNLVNLNYIVNILICPIPGNRYELTAFTTNDHPVMLARGLTDTQALRMKDLIIDFINDAEAGTIRMTQLWKAL